MPVTLLLMVLLVTTLTGRLNGSSPQMPVLLSITSFPRASSPAVLQCSMPVSVHDISCKKKDGCEQRFCGGPSQMADQFACGQEHLALKHACIAGQQWWTVAAVQNVHFNPWHVICSSPARAPSGKCAMQLVASQPQC